MQLQPETVATACIWAKDWLRLPGGELNVVVFDADDTLVTLERSLQTNTELVRALYRSCLNRGAIVYIVTARLEEGRDELTRELAGVDIHAATAEKPGYLSIFMRPDMPTKSNVAARAHYDVAFFKHRCRSHIMHRLSGIKDNLWGRHPARGRRTVPGAPRMLSVGDQWWDILKDDETMDSAIEQTSLCSQCAYVVQGMEEEMVGIKLPSL